MKRTVSTVRVVDVVQKATPRDCQGPTDVLSWAKESQQKVWWVRLERVKDNTVEVPVDWTNLSQLDTRARPMEKEAEPGHSTTREVSGVDKQRASGMEQVNSEGSAEYATRTTSSVTRR